jgi:hypothetical protein
MAKVTYFDADGSAPRVTWRGVTFLHGQPVEVEDEHVLAKAIGNPFFEVEGEGEHGETPQKRKGGWPAGKPRKPREEPAQTQAEEPDDDGGDDE